MRIVAMDGSAPQNGMTVRIDNGRIVSIGPTASTAADADQVVDGAGLTLLPGLIDAHVHVYQDHELPLFVANGVTTVRNMWGTPGVFALRQRVLAGTTLGPSIVTAGPIIDGTPPIWPAADVATNADEGRALVRAHRDAGYDFIKVYTRLPAAAFDAIEDEARILGLRFAGHASRAKGLENVLRSSIWSVEHLDGYLPAILNPSSGYDPATGNLAPLFALLRDIQGGTRPWSDLFLPAERTRLAQISAANDTAHVPTLVYWQQRYVPQSENPAELARPELRFVHPAVRAEWRAESDQLYASFSDEEMRLLRFQHDEDFRIVADLIASGAEVIVGTDARNRYVVFGFAIHDELALLVRAGLTPYQAMEAATANAARFLGRQADIGTVAVGRQADLVLYTSDPTVSIANSRAIAGTILRGRYLSRAQLDAALEQVAAGFL
ncbi:MAG: amidohydrolase family protein [Sphingomonas sp.]